MIWCVSARVLFGVVRRTMFNFASILGQRVRLKHKIWVFVGDLTKTYGTTCAWQRV